MTSFKILSPVTGNFNYVVADSIYHAIQKVVELDNYVESNCAYFKVNGVETLVRISTNTNYHLN